METAPPSGGFDALGLNPNLVRVVHGLGFEAPTPIQREAIPPILGGRDIIATAQTGSGKTAAFVLPVLQKLSKGHARAPRVLILSPTRELAVQIDDALHDFAKGSGLHGVAVYGGVGMGNQERAFHEGVDIVVATPGRLLDHMQRRNVDFHALEFLILDEADRMLEMGFLPDVRRIVSALPKRRQTLLFSATMLPEMEALSRTILRDPVRIASSPAHRPPTTINQEAYPVPQHLKTALLIRLLARAEMVSVVVFVRTKRRADKVAKMVQAAGFEVAVIHGNRSQNQREQALHGFRTGHFQVLVATDVASRGIDVAGISHVINYDVPAVPTDYVHRVGRTARMEAEGDAVTFIGPEEEGDFRSIEKVLGKRIERQTLADFNYRQPAPAARPGQSGPRRPPHQRGGGGGHRGGGHRGRQWQGRR